MNRHADPLWRISVFIALIVLLAACSTEAEPFFPTPRPTLTPLPTSTLMPATITPIPSPTDPIVTVPPNNSASANTISTASSISRLFNGSPAPLDDANGLDIQYFTTDSQSVDAGGTLTLYWSISGANGGTIYRLTDSDGHDQFWQVGQTGTQLVTVDPKTTVQARFELQINNASSHLEKIVSIPISGSIASSGGSVNCPQAGWVFTPSPNRCPSAAATLTTEAQQGFEHGQMLWIGLAGQIIVLFDDGKAPGWAVYPDQFKDGQPDHDPSINAPAGKLQPVRGFGLVWRSQPGVRDRLGWALATEAEFDGFSQADNQSSPKTTQYVATRDHQVAQLNGDHTWTLITATIGTPPPIATSKH